MPEKIQEAVLESRIILHALKWGHLYAAALQEQGKCANFGTEQRIQHPDLFFLKSPFLY